MEPAGTRCLGVVAAFSAMLATGPTSAAVAAPVTSSDQQHAFTQARLAANEAARAGDWDTFLDESYRALEALPETEAAHLDRAETILLVGDHRLEERSEQQLRRSLTIIERYIEELEQNYGDAASGKRGWMPAHKLAEELRAQLPPSPPPAPDAPPEPAPLDRRTEEATDTPGANAKTMVIGGAVATGLGAVLVITGLALIGPWREAGGTYPAEERDTATQRYRRRAGASLGTLIPGAALLGTGIGLTVVGLRRLDSQRSTVSVAPGSVRIFF